MTTDELKIWFFEKLHNCYPVYYTRNVVCWFYDDKIVRKNKLLNIIGDTLIIKTDDDKISGRCLFCQFVDTKILWCEYDSIWFSFYDEHFDDYYEVQKLITSWLLYYPKMQYYTAKGSDFNFKECDLKKMTII